MSNGKTPKAISKEQQSYFKNIRAYRRKIKWTRWILLLLFFVLWQTATQLKWIDSFIFSSPIGMWQAAVELVKSGILWQHLAVTIGETMVGFLLGTALGTALAVLLWWNSFLSDVLEPYLVVLNALPKTALAPIIIVWIGNNVTSIITVALLTSVVVTIMTVLEGFCRVEEEKIKLIRIFGGNKAQILTKVVLPDNVPCIVNALKINVGLSFVGVIVGEFLVAKMGLGYLITYGSQIFKMDWVLLSVILLAVLAALMYQMIVSLEKRILKRRNQ